jgi:hypothetical protein
MENELNILSNRSGFNTALRHFKTVMGYVSEIQGGKNLADLINESLEAGEIQRYQAKSIVSALLVDKFNYAWQSFNVEQTVESADKVQATISGWNNLQFIITYFHPQAGLFVFNPKNNSHWESVLPLTKDELIVIYCGPVGDIKNTEVLSSAVGDFLKVLYGKKVTPKDDYKGKAQEVETPTPVSTAPAQAPKRRVTPRYSVQVTNELFHNGNVEAWKRIVDSYKGKYSDLDVLIWYENERINDINALFKWGKVKHGGAIFFSVAGENIKDVSKLQRYLFEGASPRFEVFLRGAVGRVLDLF